MDKWLSHPTALKIISVILGLLLFAVVHNDLETSPQAVSNIDTKVMEAVTITPTGLDQDKYVLTAMEPTVTRLVVEGRISTLRTAANEEYVVNVDLSNASPGIHELPLTVKLPRNIREVELSPRRVTVRIEELVTRTFDVQVLTEGQPAAGYVLGTPEIASGTPAQVEVTLPKYEMDRVGVVAATLDVSGADKTVSNKRARVVVYDSEGEAIEGAVVQPATVHAEARVTLPFKRVPLQVRYTGTLGEGLSLVSVKPEVEEVTVYAPQEELDNITIYDGIVLDLSKVRQSGVVRVKTVPVDGIESVSPGEIGLDVVLEHTVTRTLNELPIAISGEPDGTSAVIRNPANGRMNLTLRGAEAVLQAVSASDIRILAKVDGLAPGVHSVPLELDLPPYVEPVLEDGRPMAASIEIIDETAATEEEPDDEIEVGGTPSAPPAGDSGEPDIPVDGGGGNAGDGEGDGSGNEGGSGGGTGNGSVNALVDRAGRMNGVREQTERREQQLA